MTAAMDEDRTKTSTLKRISLMPTLTGGRHFVVKLRLSDSEYDALRRRATTAGMSVQRFLIDAAMSGSAAQSAERRRADVNEPQGGSALEDETASVLWRGPMKLGDDMSEYVVAFNDRRVDAINVSSTGDGVAGEH